ncbi:hypothetical protein NQ314_019358 [Rhamnusium bicolor]|uniref:Uncharacterized protein n=1 Tax=Rhamnusium bicolor TaxID=1586634 RepID=A0AAV8WPB2_9CUCU|nr:hypothetical protein NQ314_019358 [Rhamnusium bicolor]
MSIRNPTEGYKTTHNGKKLDYKNLAEIVHADDKYEFLRDIMPKKITVLEFKRIMARKMGNDRDTSKDDEDSSSSSSDDEDSSSEDSEESNASA